MCLGWSQAEFETRPGNTTDTEGGSTRLRDYYDEYARSLNDRTFTLNLKRNAETNGDRQM
jgi:hypothetical protein